MIKRLTREEGISAIINTRYECGRRSPAADILNEENISYLFDVQVIVDELKYEGRSIRGIVPPALRGDAV